MIQMELNTKDLTETFHKVLDCKILGNQLKKALVNDCFPNIDGETVKEVIVSMVKEAKEKMFEEIELKLQEMSDLKPLRRKAAFAVFDMIVDEIENNPMWADEILDLLLDGPDMPMMLLITLQGKKLSVNINMKFDEDNNVTYMFNTKAGSDIEGKFINAMEGFFKDIGIVHKLAAKIVGKENIVQRMLTEFLRDFFDMVDITIEGR